MAQKKHTIELTRVELEHLRSAVDATQLEHEKAMSRSNPVLSRIAKKLDEAHAAATEPGPDKPAKGDGGADA